MAIDFPTSPTAGQVYSYNGVTYVYTAQGVWATAGASAVGIIGGSPQGRLTLQTGVPVMTTTQSGKTTIFYTPYVGDRVPIYDGTNMVMTTFTELSVATTDTTKSPAAIGASKVNDWFVWNDAGTVRIGHGPDWTNDTTRSAGTALVMVNGIWLNNAAITNGPAASRGTYVGTTRSDTSSQLNWQIGGSASGGVIGNLAVWNCYNRVNAAATCTDTGVLYTYSSATTRQARGSASNAIYFVVGLAEDAIVASFTAKVNTVAVSSAFTFHGVGLDTTTGFAFAASVVFTGSATMIVQFVSNQGQLYPGIGFHFISRNEAGDGANANSFDGSFNDFVTVGTRM